MPLPDSAAAAADVADGLRRTGSLGGFFAVEVGLEVGGEGAGPDWHPFTRLLEPTGRELPAQVQRTRETLAGWVGLEAGDVEERVAASLWFLGWASRLVSPWLGAAVLGRVVPLVSAADLLWRDAPGQPLPLAVLAPAGVNVADHPVEDVAQSLYDACAVALVQPLAEAVGQAVAVSEQVLWGNVAAAVAGAVGTLARSLPPYAGVARALGEQVLTTGALGGQGAYEGAQFVRRTCCLLYRLPGAGLCADCVLARH